MPDTKAPFLIQCMQLQGLPLCIIDHYSYLGVVLAVLGASSELYI